jgi:disulfide bond formation protein DsbB
MIADLQNVAREKTASVTLALGTAALAVVGSAWAFQFAGYLPCQLCLWQRIPYYVAIPLLLGAGLIAFGGGLGKRALRAILLVAGLIFVGSTLLAMYHSGVEWGFWPGPTSCGAGGNFSTTDANDLLGALSTTRPPSCNEAAGRFFGLSFAGWNVVASIGLSAACFLAATSVSNKSSNAK